MFYSLPISLIRQYCFCPRIVYFQELLKLNPTMPQWVKQGEDLHDKQEKLFKNRTLKRFNLNEAQQLFNVIVSSETLYLHGVVDSVLKTSEQIYPIEFKLSGNKPMQGQILQLTAYAMLLEKKYQSPCKQGFILYENKGKTHIIDFAESLQKQVLNIRDNIGQILSTAQLPNSNATTAQCTQCEYLNYCNDRD